MAHGAALARVVNVQLYGAANGSPLGPEAIMPVVSVS
jgi:hypothetical protein